MTLKKYEIVVNGITHVVQLDEDDAKRNPNAKEIGNLSKAEQTVTKVGDGNVKPTPANKAAGASNKADDGKAGNK